MMLLMLNIWKYGNMAGLTELKETLSTKLPLVGSVWNAVFWTEIFRKFLFFTDAYYFSLSYQLLTIDTNPTYAELFFSKRH